MVAFAFRRLHGLRRGLLPLLLPVLLGLITVAGTGCVTTGTNPVSGNTRAYGYSWEQEVQLGTEADAQVQQQYGVYGSDELTQYVEELGQKMLAESHMRRPDTPEKFRNTEFHFRVLDSPVINAFALPGGYVYVTRGLLAHLNNEAQLSVVLGHEIAHVAARHASQQAARQQFAQGILMGGAVIGQAVFGGNVGEGVLGIGGTAAQLLSLSYSRDNERESDRLGVEYATRGGYDAAEGSAFFTALKRKSEQRGQSLPTWQSTHPDPGQREDTIVELAREWTDRVGGTSATRNAEAYYGMLDDIVLGVNPRQGFVEESVFYHPDLKFQFPLPAGWQVDNQTSQVVAVQPDEEAYMILRLVDAATPGAAAQDFTGQKGVQVVERTQTSVNGHDARRVLAEAQTDNGQLIRILSYFIAYDGNVYRQQGLTTAEQYSTYESPFERSMTGFDRLEDPDKLNVEPARIEVRSVPRSAAFQTFVEEGALPEDMSPADLAIMNQVELNETISQGTTVKLPK